jgi:hypothetical protein
VQAGGVLLAQVQADELRVRVVGGVMWLGPRRFRLLAGCGSAGWCRYDATAPCYSYAPRRCACLRHFRCPFALHRWAGSLP